MSLPFEISLDLALGGPGANYRGDYQALHIINTTAHLALIAGAWAVVAVAVVLAIARFTDPNWTLAVVASVFSLAIFTDAMLINTAVVQPRYIIAPALLVYTALVALLRPRSGGGASRARARGRMSGGLGEAGRAGRPGLWPNSLKFR